MVTLERNFDFGMGLSYHAKMTMKTNRKDSGVKHLNELNMVLLFAFLLGICG
jgi:hypothetical protein